MNGRPRILLVDDQPTIRSVLRRLLQQDHEVVECEDGEAALKALRTGAFNAAILDLDLPKLSGWEVLRRARVEGLTTPVLLLTSAADLDSRVRGLDGGADDYITKPFAAPELLARVRALLRRQGHPAGAGGSIVRVGSLTMDRGRRSVAQGDHTITLTRLEYALLDLLARQPGQVVSREAICHHLWPESRSLNNRATDTLVWRLRKKLGADGERLRNLPGIGFVLDS